MNGWPRYPWQNDTMRHTPYHRQNNRAGAALASVVMAALLSGCVAGPSSSRPAVEGNGGQASSPAAAASPAGHGQPAATPTPQGSGPAEEPLANTSAGASPADAAATETVKRTVTDALDKLAAGTPKPATAQVSEALTGAGIAPAVQQVSQSRTPTGLEADAIEAAVLQGKDCVIGQIREGAVTVTVLPVLASGKCFVGS
ncbi:hypothetical protein GCM10007170_31850 [Arthrobacter liuii]|uniref:DUF6993 domain-containing protein n=2 Tax=Arthrobacter liuii TaxID=1476996 RepID=A0ABQ2AV66_9MICC|nr:hypothetical protein GCM10007170_31850 [Arthrobacter liuii]